MAAVQLGEALSMTLPLGGRHWVKIQLSPGADMREYRKAARLLNLVCDQLEARDADQVVRFSARGSEI